MPHIQSLELRMSSGAAGTTLQTVERVQNVSVGVNLNRTDVKVLGRFKSLNDRPAVTFSPPQFNVSYIKSSREVEQNLGILNTTGVGVAFADTDGLTVAGYGARNFQLIVSPAQSNNYYGQINILSGVVNSFSVSASVNEPARASFAGEALEWTNTANNNAKTAQNYATELVIPENVRISGIDISGYGLSGITIQSFDLGINFSRQSAFQLGSRFPRRLISDLNASVSLRGFFEGITEFTGLAQYSCGQPYTGTFYVTLQPACSSTAGTTYVIKNPTLDSIQLGSQVGSFTSVDLGFSVPLSVNAQEAGTGANVIIL